MEIKQDSRVSTVSCILTIHVLSMCIAQMPHARPGFAVNVTVKLVLDVEICMVLFSHVETTSDSSVVCVFLKNDKGKSHVVRCDIPLGH